MQDISGRETESVPSSGGPLLGIPSYTHHSTANPTRAPPQYDDIPRPSAVNRPSTAYVGAVGRAPAAVVRSGATDPVYFYTESYPFGGEQFDKLKEDNYNIRPDQIPGGGADVPVLNALSFKQLSLNGEIPSARYLREWDMLCVTRHLGAVANSIATPEELDDFVLMKDETPLHFLRLAGISDAPGLHLDVAQRCRMAFTNKDRLVFTQAKHSAEVGIPVVCCCNSFLPCCDDRWSSRTWTSYYASIHTSEILQVFVQQTFKTNYHATGCACHDCCLGLCMVGGSMKTDKDIEGVTQTMGDYDPEGICKRYDKTRQMRQSLIIRYVDCATHSVRQTVAMAHPDTPASQLYEMARSIEEKIILRSADWIKSRSIPRPLMGNAFQDIETMTPFLKRRSFKILLFVLLIVSLIMFSVNVSIALVMLFAVLLSYGGSFINIVKATKAGFSASSLVFGIQGSALLIYVVSFLTAISTSGTN